MERVLFQEKDLSQSPHAKGFTLRVLCRRSWERRLEETEKVFPQAPHAYGFSPVCTRRWALRLLACVKLLPHREQTKGRSPECVRTCTLRWLLRANDLLQSEQPYGRSPECVRMWTSRALAHTHIFPHSLHFQMLREDLVFFALDELLSLPLSLVWASSEPSEAAYSSGALRAE